MVGCHGAGGSFNLNNLFSRFNFTTQIDELPAPDAAGAEIVTRLDSDDPRMVKFRTFKGRLVQAKSPADGGRLAERIAAMDADVLAIQEGAVRASRPRLSAMTAVFWPGLGRIRSGQVYFAIPRVVRHANAVALQVHP